MEKNSSCDPSMGSATKASSAEHCACKAATGLFIPQKELSYCVAGSILGIFFVFMAGFFWGKQCAMKDFLHKINQDLFADQVAASLYMLKEPLQQEVHMESSELSSELIDLSNTVGTSNLMGDLRDTEALDVETDNELDTESEGEADGESEASPMSGAESHHFYYAQLIGFGTASAADQFAKRIARRGFSVKVEKRYSKTARGKTLIWYQVVTDTYTDKAYLEQVVSVLMKQEKLKDVRIIDC